MCMSADTFKRMNASEGLSSVASFSLGLSMSMRGAAISGNGDDSNGSSGTSTASVPPPSNNPLYHPNQPPPHYVHSGLMRCLRPPAPPRKPSFQDLFPVVPQVSSTAGNGSSASGTGRRRSSLTGQALWIGRRRSSCAAAVELINKRRPSTLFGGTGPISGLTHRKSSGSGGLLSTGWHLKASGLMGSGRRRRRLSTIDERLRLSNAGDHLQAATAATIAEEDSEDEPTTPVEQKIEVLPIIKKQCEPPAAATSTAELPTAVCHGFDADNTGNGGSTRASACSGVVEEPLRIDDSRNEATFACSSNRHIVQGCSSSSTSADADSGSALSALPSSFSSPSSSSSVSRHSAAAVPCASATSATKSTNNDVADQAIKSQSDSAETKSNSRKTDTNASLCESTDLEMQSDGNHSSLVNCSSSASSLQSSSVAAPSTVGDCTVGIVESEVKSSATGDAVTRTLVDAESRLTANIVDKENCCRSPAVDHCRHVPAVSSADDAQCAMLRSENETRSPPTRRGAVVSVEIQRTPADSCRSKATKTNPSQPSSSTSVYAISSSRRSRSLDSVGFRSRLEQLGLLTPGLSSATSVIM